MHHTQFTYAEPRDLQQVFSYNYFASLTRRTTQIENDIDIPANTSSQRNSLQLFDSIYSGGNSYTFASVLFQTSGSGGAIELELSNGKLVEARITNRGSGYTSPPNVVVAGDGINAKVAVTITNDGRLAHAIIVDEGDDYTTASADVTAGNGATGNVVIADGRIVDIVITNEGNHYSEPPRVVITGDGTGAEASAIIENGKVVAVLMQSRQKQELTRQILIEETESIDGKLRRYYPQFQYPLRFSRECGAKAILRKWCVIKTGYRLIMRELQPLVNSEERNKLAQLAKEVEAEIDAYTSANTKAFDFSDVISVASSNDIARGDALIETIRTSKREFFL